MKLLCLLALILPCYVSVANAQTTQVRYRISDSLTLDAYRTFEAALKLNPAIRELEFFNSNGSSGYADSIVNLFQLKIDELKLHTYARGFCDSTCAFIFLIGHKRTLLNGTEDNPTILKLHPIFNASMNEVVSFSTDKYIQEISSRSANKITQEVLRKMYLTTDRYGGIIIKQKPGADGKYIYFQARYGDQLQAISSHSLIELGIDTEE